MFPAHGAAYEQAKVLHRDISAGNILIDKDGKGVLIDWDLCVWLENKEEVERVGQKIVRALLVSLKHITHICTQGTWRFISAELLQGRRPRPHLLRDDLESFVHVLYYLVLRYRPIASNGPAKEELLNGIHDVFDSSQADSTAGPTGGWEKSKVLLGHGPFPSQFIAEEVKPVGLAALMYDVCGIFAPLYVSRPVVDHAGRNIETPAARRQRSELATCHGRLESSEYLASRFRHWLFHYHEPACPGLEWLPADGAVDQYRTFPSVHDERSQSRSSRKRTAEAEELALPVAKARRLSADGNASAGASARAGSCP